MDQRSIPGSIQLFKKPINVTTSFNNYLIRFAKRSALFGHLVRLTVPNNERFITDQLGIDRSDVPIEVLQAPPSYYSGAKVYIVTDMPDIQSVHNRLY